MVRAVAVPQRAARFCRRRLWWPGVLPLRPPAPPPPAGGLRGARGLRPGSSTLGPSGLHPPRPPWFRCPSRRSPIVRPASRLPPGGLRPALTQCGQFRPAGLTSAARCGILVRRGLSAPSGAAPSGVSVGGIRSPVVRPGFFFCAPAGRCPGFSWTNPGQRPFLSKSSPKPPDTADSRPLIHMFSTNFSPEPLTFSIWRATLFRVVVLGLFKP